MLGPKLAGVKLCGLKIALTPKPTGFKERRGPETQGRSRLLFGKCHRLILPLKRDFLNINCQLREITLYFVKCEQECLHLRKETS